MITSGGTPTQATVVQVVRPDPIATFFVLAAALFLLTITAIVWRTLLNRVELEAVYEATLAETAELDRLSRLDATTLTQQLQATEQSLNDLRAAIPTAPQAQAELSRYDLYANESGVSARSQLNATVRHESLNPAFSDVFAQRWTVTARGRAHDVIRFLERIAAGRFAAWRIENVVLKPDETLGAGEWDVVATADVVVYSYPP